MKVRYVLYMTSIAISWKIAPFFVTLSVDDEGLRFIRFCSDYLSKKLIVLDWLASLSAFTGDELFSFLSMLLPKLLEILHLIYYCR